MSKRSARRTKWRRRLYSAEVLLDWWLFFVEGNHIKVNLDNTMPHVLDSLVKDTKDHFLGRYYFND